MSRRVAIVPHTHWDREWYEPFQTFRYQLVQLLDGLLPQLESDPSYSRFLLDGQMAVVDDYLEVRPEAEDRLRAIAATGRLSMGPWYILMDEFLVSGETIIRNLQMGMRRGAAFGGITRVGYLPDMFGHIAQMPQILRLAGFEHAVVWRGVPSAITATGFWWEAPDGSRVRAEYLPVGYSNGAALPDDAKALVRRIEDHEQEVSEFLIGPMLVMNGSDHLRPQPRLGRVVHDANSIQDDYQIEITSLTEYLPTAPTDHLQTWRGELRSGARANLLMGVTSNRVDVKQAAGRAERALERRAEPLAALFCPPDAWPRRLLEIAWLGMVRNSAHDSICACSVDEVVDAVVHRYAESRQIAEEVASNALTSLARSMKDPGPVVVNPVARSRGGIVELTVVGDQPMPDVQVISQRTGLPGAMTLDADTVRTVLGMLQGPKIDNDTFVQAINISEEDDGLHVTVSLGPEERPIGISEAKQEVYTRLGARPDMLVHIRMDQPPIRRVVAKVHDIPGFGWARFEAAPLVDPVTAETDPATGALTLRNGLVTIAFDPEDGTFSLNGQPGWGKLVDGGDLGDSYNYSPPRADSLVDHPESVSLTIAESGPVRAAATCEARYHWPDHIEGSSGGRVGETAVNLTTRVELRADDPVVRISHSFINPSRDHRLRVHLPLPEPTASSEAECSFATVVRGLEAEGRGDEFGLPTFPSRRFVRAGGLTVCHDRVEEYELIDISEHDGEPRARTLALTLLRATGMLSRLGMTYRPFPAGPLTPVQGLQLVGRQIETQYAVTIEKVDPWAMADDVLVPLESVQSLGGGWRGSRGSELSVEGAIVSAVRREAGLVEIRLFNPSDRDAEARMGSSSGWVVDLRGLPLRPFEGTVTLRPWEILTVRLTSS